MSAYEQYSGKEVHLLVDARTPDKSIRDTNMSLEIRGRIVGETGPLLNLADVVILTSRNFRYSR